MQGQDVALLPLLQPPFVDQTRTHKLSKTQNWIKTNKMYKLKSSKPYISIIKQKRYTRKTEYRNKSNHPINQKPQKKENESYTWIYELFAGEILRFTRFTNTQSFSVSLQWRSGKGRICRVLQCTKRTTIKGLWQ